ncbi:HEAT repeat domain-containing protein [Methanothermobacter sp.]|nr:HEAT repeat domain-containing protein [Methanothermobacter sp.]MDI9618105.1 hypothetical protein [Methanothermobacter sp.]
MEALESEDYTVRLDAARALEELSDERSVPALIDALRYEKWQRD